MSDFSSDRWHLAGVVSRGIGRSWLAVNHGLDDRWGQGPWSQAAPTRAAAVAWVRGQLDAEREDRVPVRIEQRSAELSFLYVNRKHIPEGEWT